MWEVGGVIYTNRIDNDKKKILIAKYVTFLLSNPNLSHISYLKLLPIH